MFQRCQLFGSMLDVLGTDKIPESPQVVSQLRAMEDGLRESLSR